MKQETDKHLARAAASAKKRQRLLWCALLLASLLWPPWGFSLSLYDVIKMSQAGYPDEEIVKAIQVTGARFVLDGDSLVRLKEAGVSEPVIQALLKASHAAASPQLSSIRAFDATAPPALEQSAGAFAASPFEEEGAGHAGHHQHYVLAVNRVPVLILRSEAEFSRIAQRAQAVVRGLNGLVRSPEGRFFAVFAAELSVWYRARPTAVPVQVLKVVEGDVIAYQRRSLGPVSAKRLAAYWAAALNDFTQLFLFSRAPTDLGKLHMGENLSRIHSELAALAGKKEGTPLVSEPILRSIDHLAVEDKEHLIELSRQIPAEFPAPR